MERERRATVEKKVKDAWAEGSAGLRVTSKQGQTFCIPPKKGKSQRRSIPIPANPSPLHCLPSPKGQLKVSVPPGYSVHSWDDVPYQAPAHPRVQASSKNFIFRIDIVHVQRGVIKDRSRNGQR